MWIAKFRFPGVALLRGSWSTLYQQPLIECCPINRISRPSRRRDGGRLRLSSAGVSPDVVAHPCTHHCAAHCFNPSRRFPQYQRGSCAGSSTHCEQHNWRSSSHHSPATSHLLFRCTPSRFNYLGPPPSSTAWISTIKHQLQQQFTHPHWSVS